MHVDMKDGEYEKQTCDIKIKMVKMKMKRNIYTYMNGAYTF